MNTPSPLISNTGAYLLPVRELPTDILGKLPFSPVDGAAPRTAEPLPAARWNEGDMLLGGRVLRSLQISNDAELYLIRRLDGTSSVVKVQRRSSSTSDARIRAMFQREGNVLERLRGGIAPRLLGRGEMDGCRYLEMEYLAGVDVESEAARSRDLDEDARRIALFRLSCGIASAYTLLHAARVVHANVHPRNVLVHRDGHVRLIDFGFAVAIDPASEHLPEARADERGGAAFFYEPELASTLLAGKPAPPPTFGGEQYAIASLIYRLITGAYTRDFSLGRAKMLREIAELPALAFRDRGVAAWPDMEAVLRRALAKEPSERFPSVAAFAAALSVVRVGRAFREAELVVIPRSETTRDPS